jgi:5-methylcytosine-specific restriction enzyme A
MPSFITDPTTNRWHETRPRVEPLWRSWCKSPTWKSIRRHRLAEEPRCRQCAIEGRTAVAIYVDHVKPHLGQWSLFFQYENTQSLCSHHHNMHKHQRARQLHVEPMNHHYPISQSIRGSGAASSANEDFRRLACGTQPTNAPTRRGGVR